MGGLGRCSVTNQVRRGQPLKWTMWSLPSSLGRALAVASLVSATVMFRLPSRNPICWPPGSYNTRQALNNAHYSTSINAHLLGDGWLNGHRYDSCKDAAVESSGKLRWFVRSEHQSHSVSRLDRTATELVQHVVGHLLRTHSKLV